MTYDGYLAVAMPGIIAVLDRNFENMQYILLKGEAVDNGISMADIGVWAGGGYLNRRRLGIQA